MILFNQETKTFHLKTFKTSYLNESLRNRAFTPSLLGRPLKSEILIILYVEKIGLALLLIQII